MAAGADTPGLWLEPPGLPAGGEADTRLDQEAHVANVTHKWAEVGPRPYRPGALRGRGNHRA